MLLRWKKSKKSAPEAVSDEAKQFALSCDLGEKQKNEGIEAAYRGADSKWKRAATECLQKMIETREFVTSEDVVLELNERGITTSENRAMGAIMQSFSRAGLIESTGRFTTSRRPECHKSPVRIWRSKKFGAMS